MLTEVKRTARIMSVTKLMLIRGSGRMKAFETTVEGKSRFNKGKLGNGISESIAFDA